MGNVKSSVKCTGCINDECVLRALTLTAGYSACIFATAFKPDNYAEILVFFGQFIDD